MNYSEHIHIFPLCLSLLCIVEGWISISQGFLHLGLLLGFPSGSAGKNPLANARNFRDAGSIPQWGRSEEGNGYLLQYSCLENPADRGAWWATVNVVAKSGKGWATKYTHRVTHATHLWSWGGVSFLLEKLQFTRRNSFVLLPSLGIKP